MCVINKILSMMDSFLRKFVNMTLMKIFTDVIKLMINTSKQLHNTHTHTVDPAKMVVCSHCFCCCFYFRCLKHTINILHINNQDTTDGGKSQIVYIFFTFFNAMNMRQWKVCYKNACSMSYALSVKMLFLPCE